MNNESLAWIDLLFAMFWTILFLQSGLDKVWHYKSEKGWIVQKFSRTVFAPIMPLVFLLLTSAEVIAGTLNLVSAIMIIFFGSTILSLPAAVVSCLTILLLFTGLRFAKDYQSAALLTGYIVLGMINVFIVN
ncbi:MAG TPA: DoxX family protein [Bacteroidia bacterium]|nr:DoxX family protein [Bacteroidia bacterium]HNT80595.1 DoxX family protein [Bacteroidia bacterium]